MSGMRAMWASDWRFEFGHCCAPIRERDFEVDTIPKPDGLGFASASRVVAVQLSSSYCPGSVPVMSSFRLASVWTFWSRDGT
jgi:hypothetical protein